MFRLLLAKNASLRASTVRPRLPARLLIQRAYSTPPTAVVDSSSPPVEENVNTEDSSRHSVHSVAPSSDTDASDSPSQLSRTKTAELLRENKQIGLEPKRTWLLSRKEGTQRSLLDGPEQLARENLQYHEQISDMLQKYNSTAPPDEQYITSYRFKEAKAKYARSKLMKPLEQNVFFLKRLSQVLKHSRYEKLRAKHKILVRMGTELGADVGFVQGTVWAHTQHIPTLRHFNTAKAWWHMYVHRSSEFARQAHYVINQFESTSPEPLKGMNFRLERYRHQSSLFDEYIDSIGRPYLAIRLRRMCSASDDYIAFNALHHHFEDFSSARSGFADSLTRFSRKIPRQLEASSTLRTLLKQAASSANDMGKEYRAHVLPVMLHRLDTMPPTARPYQVDVARRYWAQFWRKQKEAGKEVTYRKLRTVKIFSFAPRDDLSVPEKAEVARQESPKSPSKRVLKKWKKRGWRRLVHISKISPPPKKDNLTEHSPKKQKPRKKDYPTAHSQ